MAYDFFPKDKGEILRRLGSWKEDNVKEVERLFDMLKSEIPEPINIDVGQKTLVNVSRQLQGKFDINLIRSKANLKIVKIKFGNGSSGNRGVNNRGNLFETNFADALNAWWAGDEVNDKVMLEAINDLDKTYNIKKNKTFKVDVVGG